MFRRLTAVVTTASFILSPIVAQAATTLGAESPQAVVERANKAAAKGDLVELAACLDPDSRVEMATAMLAGATMMVAFMGMGASMAEGLAEGMSEATGASDKDAKAKAAKGKAEMEAKMAKSKTALSAVFKKHGLPDLLDEKAEAPKGDPKALLAKVDQPLLIGDLMGVMQTIGDKGMTQKAGDKMGIPKEVTGYKIAGDSATAQGGGETIQFVKVDGRWFLKAPEKKKEAGEK